MRSRLLIFVLLVLLAALAGAAAWRVLRVPTPPTTLPFPAPELISLAGPTMGTTWSVQLRRLPPAASREQVVSAVQAILDRIEGQMSTFRPESDLSRFNRHQGTDWHPVPADVAAVAAEARRVSEQTGGAFDVTVGPLVYLWGFGPDHPAGPFGTVPSDAQVADAKARVGYGLLDVRTSPPALRKERPDLYADLSGIAKGYAADRVAQRLEAMGASDYLVEVGGELRVKGSSDKGRPWRVGIETPKPGARRVLLRVELKDLSLATSGDYRNFFEKDGRRFSHEIDPRTGRPAAHDLASVSVAHPSCAHADAMATALMVLGPEAGEDLARRLGLAALFVVRRDGAFEIRATPQFEPLLVKEEVGTTRPARSDEGGTPAR